MRYISLRIENYKSFFKPVEIEFKPSINLIVGQNNVGKTALLDVLSNSAERKPHLNKTQYCRNNY
jgi:AAA15 family ATPase/GTPase